MAKKQKTIDDIKKQIWENSLHTCEYISGNAKPGSKIHVRCVIHNIEFDVSYDAIRKSTKKHHICPECKKDDDDKNKILLNCDYCGKQYLSLRSKTVKSKFHFCCRSCKDQAQQVNSGEKFFKAYYAAVKLCCNGRIHFAFADCHGPRHNVWAHEFIKEIYADNGSIEKLLKMN